MTKPRGLILTSGSVTAIEKIRHQLYPNIWRVTYRAEAKSKSCRAELRADGMFYELTLAEYDAIWEGGG